jgi:hypothetical protein
MNSLCCLSHYISVVDPDPESDLEPDPDSIPYPDPDLDPDLKLNGIKKILAHTV